MDPGTQFGKVSETRRMDVASGNSFALSGLSIPDTNAKLQPPSLTPSLSLSLFSSSLSLFKEGTMRNNGEK